MVVCVLCVGNRPSTLLGRGGAPQIPGCTPCSLRFCLKKATRKPKSKPATRHPTAAPAIAPPLVLVLTYVVGAEIEVETGVEAGFVVGFAVGFEVGIEVRAEVGTEVRLPGILIVEVMEAIFARDQFSQSSANTQYVTARP